MSEKEDVRTCGDAEVVEQRLREKYLDFIYGDGSEPNSDDAEDDEPI